MLVIEKQADLSQIKPVKFSYRFLQSLLATESDFENRGKFRFRRNGQGRLMHHLTKADLQFATILQVGINAQGQAEYTNRHQMYQHLERYYEDPINKDQFYAAFDKFVMLGLLQVTQSHKGYINIEVLHYLEPDGTLGRFVTLPSLIYSQAFTAEPIAVQKMYYYACGQQGNEHHKLLQINFDKLSGMLHRQEPGHIRKIIDRLAQPFLDEQPLFSIGRMERNVFGRPKAVYQVNPSLLPAYVAGESYRELFPHKKGYRRLLKRLEAYLKALGCKAIVDHDQFLYELTFMLKDKSEGYIRYVVNRIAEMDIMKPASEILGIIREELHDRAAAALLGIAPSD